MNGKATKGKKAKKAAGTVVAAEVVTRDNPATVAVSADLAAKIRAVDAGLEAEFGHDFAYGIMAGGGLVAASNAKDGYVPPTAKPAATGPPA